MPHDGNPSNCFLNVGPLGPQTLCNACGVKWHAQKKKAAGGTRRKSTEGSRKKSRPTLTSFSSGQKGVKQEMISAKDEAVEMPDGHEEVMDDEQIDVDDEPDA